MAGVRAQQASTGTVESFSVSGYAANVSHTPENPSYSKPHSRNGSLRQTSTGSSRMPLSNVAPNRKGTGEYVANGRPAYSRIEELGQEETGAISRSGSEPDSLLDLYRHNADNGNVASANDDNDIPENMFKPETEDPEGWIHRDKLAKIESEELQAAGINLANARRSYGKNVKREPSRSKKVDDANGIDQRREEKKPRVSEPAVEEEDERSNWDLRSPEEIAADEAAMRLYSSPVLRKSGSKIPVLTSSPVPIAQERIERDTPLPRKRTMSNSMTPEETISTPKTRVRMDSTGSGMLLDEGPNSPTPGETKVSSKPTSPTKQIAKSGTTSPPGPVGVRKVTPAVRKPTSTTKPGQPGSTGTITSPSQRPRTRSGDVDRPRTAVNRPEADPPWLATMYKPDPMLPQDQQIIPTHARKQQQAQWTDEGAVPITYDRQFSPLAVHTAEGLVKMPSPPASPTAPTGPVAAEKREDSIAWPLKPMPNVRNSQNSTGRPGTSGSVTGGYSTMPKVTTPTVAQISRMSSISRPPASTNTVPPKLQEPRQAPGEKDDGTVKKGCGCCIVM